MQVRIALVILGALLLASCAPSTKITSFVDPTHDEPAFTSVVVGCYGTSLAEQQLVESVAAKRFEASGIRVFKRIDLVPPTSDVSVEESVRRFMDTGADALLMFTLVDTQIVETYLPPAFVPRSGSYPGYYSGGAVLTDAVAAYELVLLDARTGKKVWRAEATTAGGSDFTDLSRDVATKTVQRLMEDGLF